MAVCPTCTYDHCVVCPVHYVMKVMGCNMWVMEETDGILCRAKASSLLRAWTVLHTQRLRHIRDLQTDLDFHCVRMCVRVCVCACVRACVRACMRPCVCVCVCVRVCVCVCMFAAYIYCTITLTLLNHNIKYFIVVEFSIWYAIVCMCGTHLTGIVSNFNNRGVICALAAITPVHHSDSARSCNTQMYALSILCKEIHIQPISGSNLQMSSGPCCDRSTRPRCQRTREEIAAQSCWKAKAIYTCD